MPFYLVLTDTYPACRDLRASSRLPSETAPSFVPCNTPYYGGSVAIGVATRRRSRICTQTTVVCLGPPFASLLRSFPNVHRREHFPVKNRNWLFPRLLILRVITVSPFQGCYGGCGFAPLETGVQPIQVSPCAQDLRRVALHPFGLSRFPNMLVSPSPFGSR
jgi:hypothetical protein